MRKIVYLLLGLLAVRGINAESIVPVISPQPSAISIDTHNFHAAKQLSELLHQPEQTIDFARAKLVIDKLIDPTVDIDADLKRIDAIVIKIQSMLGSFRPVMTRCEQSKPTYMR